MSAANDTVRGMQMLIAETKRIEAGRRLGKRELEAAFVEWIAKVGAKSPLGRFLPTDAVADAVMRETINSAFITPVRADEGACTISVDPAAGPDQWVESWWDGSRLVSRAHDAAEVRMVGEHLAWPRPMPKRERCAFFHKGQSVGISSMMALGFESQKAEVAPPGERTAVWRATKAAVATGIRLPA